MKECPFCKEQVKDDAIKCRYCHSMLLPGLSMADPAGPAPSALQQDDRVTYIVDAGIIRFGKFAAAVLALFLVLGLYVFGIDVKDTLKRMDDAEHAMSDSADRLKSSQATADEAQKAITQATAGMAARAQEVQGRAKEVEALAQDAAKMKTQLLAEADQTRAVANQSAATAANSAAVSRRASANVTENVGRARTLLSQIEETLGKARTDAAIIESLKSGATDDPGHVALAGAAGGGESLLWPQGSTLSVRFLDGTQVEQSAFRAALDQWLDHANLKVRYVASGPADIRASFAGQGSYSFVGTAARAVAADKPTIVLGFADRSGSPPPNYLHEIGHALGLVHEHQNPSANLPFERARVYADLQAPPNAWPRAQVDANIFATGGYPGGRPYDRSSIMNLPMPASWFANGSAIPAPLTLSASDKRYIASLYPRIG